MKEIIKLGGELDSEINKYFGMDSQAFVEMLAKEEMGTTEPAVSLEEKIQSRISKLPEQTPFGSFVSGDSRERNIIMQETTKERKEKRKTLNEKKDTIASGLRDIEKSKTTAINRNLFTRPSEKEAKEVQDENARLVSNILQSKYGLSTNTSNVQKLNNKLNTLLTDSPETYDEIIDVINNKDDKDYLESLMNEKKKINIYEPRAIGQATVEKAIKAISFGDKTAATFLYRTAKAESDFGTDKNTFKVSSSNIMQVEKTGAYDEIIRRLDPCC